jgi:hypothetical protein
MEADWEFEIGTGAPVIDAHWAGHIDLKAHPEQAVQLPEAAKLPALATVLVQLNAPSSAVWTAKCDQWRIAPSENEPSENKLDPIEIDAPPDAPLAAYAAAQACYIDILSNPPSQWSQLKELENLCKVLSARLRTIPLRYTRADLVIRRAVLAGGEETFGITAYLVAAAASGEEALRLLAQSLAVFADSLLAA